MDIRPIETVSTGDVFALSLTCDNDPGGLSLDEDRHGSRTDW
jgi:hypothetical protein